jgi:Leucine-rich repeat (LRR) protein
MQLQEEEDDDRHLHQLPEHPRQEKKIINHGINKDLFELVRRRAHHLCFHNGISKQARKTAIHHLEMCQYNYSSISGLSHFPHLKSLCIVSQDIKEITGLTATPLLESLWICETLITKISGLDHCKRLKKLFLYSNRIAKIENLEDLKNLEFLSLADNGISLHFYS